VPGLDGQYSIEVADDATKDTDMKGILASDRALEANIHVFLHIVYTSGKISRQINVQTKNLLYVKQTVHM
jgi:hypothetical protein